MPSWPRCGSAWHFKRSERTARRLPGAIGRIPALAAVSSSRPRGFQSGYYLRTMNLPYMPALACIGIWQI